MVERRPSRRQFLQTGVGAVAVGLAGCPGGGGSGGSSPESDPTPAPTPTPGNSSGDTPTESPTATPTESPTATPTPTPRASSPKRGNQWYVRYGMTASEYQQRFTQYVDDEGLRLIDVSGYGVGGEERYAGVWADVGGPDWVAHHGLTASEYQQRFTQHTNNGFRPTVLSAYTVGGQPRFAGMWERYPGHRWQLYYGDTFQQYQSRFENLTSNGYRPTEVTGYAVGGEQRYGAIWEQFEGPSWASHHGMATAGLQGHFENYVENQEYRLTAVDGFGVSGSPRYVATWQDFDGVEWYGYWGMTGSDFQTRIDDFVDRGFRITDVSGYRAGGQTLFSAIWRREQGRQTGFDGIDDEATAYMADHGVPGLSLAVTKDERLVFARGYGYANREAHERMRPSHRLRIASISKPVTGVAVLRLLEDGRLALDDEVFGSGGILGTSYGTPTHNYPEPRQPVTVHDLLQHSSGWRNRRDTDPSKPGLENFDPMFEFPGKSQDELVQWVVGNMPLRYQPGSEYEYLNFGYCLLGRVIEAVSGKSYKQYVKDAVLTPAGIDDMVIAGNTRSERRSDEAAYYGGAAYDQPVARTDAHGGWIARPRDLLRLVVRVDGFPNKADILGSAALNELSNSDGANGRYGEGWLLRSGWRGHNGSLSGTVGWIVRQDDGLSWAVLANARDGNDPNGWQLRSRLDTAINAVSSWPAHDKF